MRNRVITALAATAAALGLLAVVLLGLGLTGALLSPPDDSDTSQVDIDREAQDPQPPLPPPSEAEVATMNEHGDYVETCMAEAGFPEYVDVNVYDPDYVPGPDWDANLTPERKAAAFIAQWGDTGSGSDYHWEDAGCAGYATHMIGADNAN